MKIYRADTLIDGSGAAPQRSVDVVVENGVIQEVTPAGSLPQPDGAEVFHLALQRTVLLAEGLCLLRAVLDLRHAGIEFSGKIGDALVALFDLA